jgi:hypothetical protein
MEAKRVQHCTNRTSGHVEFGRNSMESTLRHARLGRSQAEIDRRRTYIGMINHLKKCAQH